MPDKAKLQSALYDALDHERVGMLGLDSTSDHMQPMTHFLDREDGALYFISARDTHLVRHLTVPREVHFTIVSKDKGVHACMSGLLEQTDDPDKLDELWSPAASMWFDGGKDDHKVVLLRLPLAEAAVWLSEANALQFGIQMVRGAMSSHDPDVGEHGLINLAA